MPGEEHCPVNIRETADADRCCLSVQEGKPGCFAVTKCIFSSGMAFAWDKRRLREKCAASRNKARVKIFRELTAKAVSFEILAGDGLFSLQAFGSTRDTGWRKWGSRRFFMTATPAFQERCIENVIIN